VDAAGEAIMKYLLTSGGITNPSIEAALLDLLGKPFAECRALCIPTGVYPFPGGPYAAYRLLSRSVQGGICDLGWASLGVLELTALPSIEREHWVAAVEQADALLVGGGDVFYLSRWMQESGLAELLPSLEQLVYVGVSAGSIVTASTFGETYTDPEQPYIIGRGLGLVPFALIPHMDHPDHPESTAERIGTMAKNLPVPTYGIDDATAIKVYNGTISLISEGHWSLFTPEPWK
jgi:dipeptidase E